VVLTNAGSWRLLDEHGDPLVVGRYHNGLPQGKWTVYHTNGRKAAEGSVVRGARSGLWRVWDVEGRLESEVTYVAVEPKAVGGGYGQVRPLNPADFGVAGGSGMWPTVAWPVADPLSYVAERHGPAKTWHRNGKVKLEGNYDHDLRQGKWTEYDEQGLVTGQGEYWRDRKEGKWREGQTAMEYVAGMPRAEHERLLARLKAELASDSIERQVAAAERLESLGLHGVPALLAAIDSPDASVKIMAVRALAESLSRPAPQKLPVDEVVAKVKPLLDSPDDQLARYATLLVYRHQPAERERLFAQLLGQVRASSDPGVQRPILAAMLQSDPGCRQAIFPDLAILGEKQYREAAASWGGCCPGDPDQISFVGLALEMREDLPELLATAAKSNNAEVRCFVLRVIDALARQSPPTKIQVTGNSQQRRHPVPEEFKQLVELAQRDSDPLVRRVAENVGVQQVPFFPGGIGGGFF